MADRQKPLLLRVREVTDPNASNGPMKTVRHDGIKTSKRRHEKLPPDLEARADALFTRVGKFMGQTPESWRDGFCHDMHPDHEIIMWERIADACDQLWIKGAKVFKNMDRRVFTRLVVAVASGVVDIPSQMRGVTDEHVQIVACVFQKSNGSDEGDNR